MLGSPGCQQEPDQSENDRDSEVDNVLEGPDCTWSASAATTTVDVSAKTPRASLTLIRVGRGVERAPAIGMPSMTPASPFAMRRA